MAAAHLSAQDVANAQNFMSSADAVQTGMRVDMTLQAMQQLSRYLAAVNGRKNLVWFSGSFPVQFFATYIDPVGNSSTIPFASFDEELKETADMLVASRIAVYPVDARGVVVQPMFSSTQQTDYAKAPGGSRGSRFGADAQRSGNQLAAEHTSLDVIAQQTGGRAVHDSNGLQEAMADALNDGSNFYTLAYVPSNTNFNGAERNIQVRLSHGKADLSYRRSYYADATMLSQDGAKQDSKSVFLQSMQRGVPAASQIVFDVRVAAADQSPIAGKIAGANAELKNPVARYAIDYAASLGAIALIQGSSGVWQGHLAALAVAYDRAGNRLNWVVDNFPLHLDQASKDSAARNGLTFHQLLDLPAGDVYLRVGLYDPITGRFGTLEIPLQVEATRPAVESSK